MQRGIRKLEFEQDNDMLSINSNAFKEYVSSCNSKTVHLVCPQCLLGYTKSKYQIKNRMFDKDTAKMFCSKECRYKNLVTSKLVVCKSCNVEFSKRFSDTLKSPNHFCSKSCAATYNNTHKKHGTRRSKLEVYLEEQIRLQYPDLELLCNDKTAISSELDFYFPSLKLAIELNGIFHYEPIYGKEKLRQIQGNDERKFFLCHQAEISLAIVDSSSCKYLNEKAREKYWNIFKQIIQRY